jgi:hypothetical protein
MNNEDEYSSMDSMVPDLQSSLLCDDVRQERNGKFILIGLFDVLGVSGFPAVFRKICLVNRWCCGLGSFEQQSRIIATNGTGVVAEGKPVSISLKDDKAVATNVEIFMNVRFEKAGCYWIEVLLNGDLKLRYPLKAVKIDREGGQGHSKQRLPDNSSQ